MQNRIDRQIDGASDDIVADLEQLLDGQGLNVVAQRTAGEDGEVVVLTVDDPEAAQDAKDVDPDAAVVATASLTVRPTNSGARISLVEPVTAATVTENVDLLEPAQQLQAGIVAALDELAVRRNADHGSGGDGDVRRALLDAIGTTATALNDLDTQARAETLLVLAKAYTAIASLERAEEVELHLA